MSDRRFVIGEQVQSRTRPEYKGRVVDIDDHVPPTLYVVHFGDHIFQYEEHQLASYSSIEEEAAGRLVHCGLVIAALLSTIQRKEPMRTTSSVTDTDFPFEDDSVAFVYVPADASTTKDGRGFEHASTAAKKGALLDGAIEDHANGMPGNLLAIWPGKTRSDVFLVDDLDAAAEALA